MNTCYF